MPPPEVDTHWRNSQKPIRFFIADARSFSATFFFLIHARPWTFALALFVMFIFWLMEQRGLTFHASLRAFRRWFLGIKRPATHRRLIRRWIDFG
jgi:intracellular multiplication protein IcmT